VSLVSGSGLALPVRLHSTVQAFQVFGLQSVSGPVAPHSFQIPTSRATFPHPAVQPDRSSCSPESTGQALQPCAAPPTQTLAISSRRAVLVICTLEMMLGT
jgi:hypothetical protein